MEEEIKNLEEIINLCKEEINNNDKNITATLDLEDLKSLKNVLDSYKQLEEENKKFYEGEIFTAKQLKNIEQNQKKYFINKQVVIEKIEELNNVNNAEALEDLMNTKNYTITQLVQYVLQELLGKE